MVVPDSVRHNVLEAFHEGHFDSSRMMFRMNGHYWWYKLPSSVKCFVDSCLTCAQSKSSGAIRCTTGSLPSPGPYELLFIDIVGPLNKYDGYEYLLTMEDSFTRFARAIPIRSISAENIAKNIYIHWINTFHAPVRIHSDNGTQFTSSYLKEICSSLGIHMSTSSPNHL